MVHVIVTPDDQDRVLMDEEVHAVHFDSEHSVAQLLERLAWAVSDAEREAEAQLLGRPTA